MNLPNLITLSRILLVPFTVWLIISDAYGWAFFTFMVAGVSDGLDGFIARRWQMRTELRRYLDPLADKALLVSVYVTLGFLKVLPAWLVILVVSRDVLIVGALMLSFFMAHPVKIEPLILSKVNTLAQILFVVVVLGEADFDLAFGYVHWLGMAIVAILTVASGTAYLISWLRHMASDREEGGLR
jgi:cardiolipin synthase